jgi:hypothetical protein
MELAVKPMSCCDKMNRGRARDALMLSAGNVLVGHPARIRERSSECSSADQAQGEPDNLPTGRRGSAWLSHRCQNASERHGNSGRAEPRRGFLPEHPSRYRMPRTGDRPHGVGYTTAAVLPQRRASQHRPTRRVLAALQPGMSGKVESLVIDRALRVVASVDSCRRCSLYKESVP